MGRNWVWWLLGGGAVALVASMAFAKKEVAGDLEVTLTVSKLGNNTTGAAALFDLLTSSDAAKACPGMPKIVGVSSQVETTGSAPKIVAKATLGAMWTHTVLGPIKEQPRACMLAFIKKVFPYITDLQATRVN